MMDEEPVLDGTVLDALRALDGDGAPEILRDLHVLFARDTPLRLRALRDAVGAGDADAVLFTAHALRGSAGALGARAMTAVCRDLEDRARHHQLAGLDELLDVLEQRADAVVAALVVESDAAIQNMVTEDATIEEF